MATMDLTKQPPRINDMIDGKEGAPKIDEKTLQALRTMVGR